MIALIPMDDRGVAIAIGGIAILVAIAGLLHSPTRCRWWTSLARAEDERPQRAAVWASLGSDGDLQRQRLAVDLLEEARGRGFARARGLRVARRAIGGWLVESREAAPVVCRSDREALDEIERRLRPAGGVR